MNTKGLFRILAGVACCCGAGSAFAAIWYVPEDIPTIQAAIVISTDGDEIIVAPGTYNEAIDFLSKQDLYLHSTGGPDVTAIDGPGSGTSTVTFIGEQDPSTVLEGFTITGGDAANGGGILVLNSSPTIQRCKIHANHAAYYGGGMFNNNNDNPGGPVVIDCVFSDNHASSHGGGMYNSESTPFVANGLFSGNSAANFGGAMANFGEASNPYIGNCTFSQNSAGSTGGAMFNSVALPFITNSIFWGDSPDEITSNGGAPIVTYSDVQGGHIGDGNINADPSFRDPDSEDYRLDCESPCIDAGDNDHVWVNNDLAGDPRRVDDPETPDTGNGEAPIVDMGAHEYQADLSCFKLWVGGSCNGYVEVEITGGYPYARAAVAWGPGPGSVRVPWCYDLYADIQVRDHERIYLDGNGHFYISTRGSSRVCNWLIQAVDIDNCVKTNVTVIPE